MKGGQRRKAGTNVRREPDVAAMSEALARPGIDTRLWVFRGTVATVKTNGDFDFGDGDAVVIAPRGVDVDVIIEPYDDPVTCRYGTNFGAGVLLMPIRPGDLVLVVVPLGDLANVPEIVKVLGGPHTPIPVEDSDSKPIFRNDRVLLYGDGVPVEVRAAGGARVLVNTDGSVVFNQGDKGVAREDDPVKVTMDGSNPSPLPGTIVALATLLLATGAFTPSGNPPVPPGTDFDIDGTITGASGSVKAGD